jgi:hypothetical protein
MNAEQRMLKEDEKLKILERDIEEHDFLIKDGDEWAYYLLQHGLLKQFSKGTPKEVEQWIYNSNPSLYNKLLKKDISFEYVTRFLAQARISELEKEVDYFIDESNRVKGLI